MYKFGTASQAELNSADPRLIEIAEKVLGYGVMDFSVTEGHRSVDRQYQLYRKGLSTLDGVNKKSKHNSLPSLAIDVVPYPKIVNGINVWKDERRFSKLAGLFYSAAAELGYSIRWGGDWDNDGNNADSTFDDLPHFELITPAE